MNLKTAVGEAIAEVTAENAKITKRKEMACFFVFFELFAVIQEFCNRLPKPEIRNPKSETNPNIERKESNV